MLLCWHQHIDSKEFPDFLFNTDIPGQIPQYLFIMILGVTIKTNEITHISPNCQIDNHLPPVNEASCPEQKKLNFNSFFQFLIILLIFQQYFPQSLTQ